MKQLNFGSGAVIKKGWDNADYDNHLGANITFDFNKFPYPIKDNTYDYILADNVLEHLKDPEEAIWELARICKPNGTIRILVPHMNSEGAFCLGHINFWNEKSFRQLEERVNWAWERNAKLKVEELYITPSWLGKWIYPLWLRRKVSLLVRGIYMDLRVNLKVIKEVK